MEFVPGQCLDAVDLEQHPDLMERIAASLKYLWQIHTPHDQQAAGLLGDGLPQGYIFVDDGCDVVFNTIIEMGDWMDDRLAFQKLRLEAIPKARIDGREMLEPSWGFPQGSSRPCQYLLRIQEHLPPTKLPLVLSCHTRSRLCWEAAAPSVCCSCCSWQSPAQFLHR